MRCVWFCLFVENRQGPGGLGVKATCAIRSVLITCRPCRKAAMCFQELISAVLLSGRSRCKIFSCSLKSLLLLFRWVQWNSFNSVLFSWQKCALHLNPRALGSCRVTFSLVTHKMLLVSKELSPGSLLTDLASPSTELTCTQISVLIVFEETCLIKEFPQVENHMWLYASFSKSLFIVKEWSCCVRREGRVPGKKRALLYGISTQSQPAWDSLGLDFLVMNSVTLPIRKVKSCYSFLSHRAMLRIE